MNVALSAFLSRHLIDRRGRHRQRVLAAWAEKRTAEYWSPVERRAHLDERLAALLRHCAVHVPFYRQQLKSCEDISPATAFDVLKTLPVISRRHIQEEPDAFWAEGVTVAADDATGGSTGTPMQFKVDRSTQIARESSLMWADSLAGWQLGERTAMLWGSDKDVRAAAHSLRLALRWRIENRRWYNAFQMSERDRGRYHRALERFRPHYLVAYASALHAFAEFLSDHQIKPSYPLRALISSAEMLPDSVRSRIEKIFEIPIFDRYGNREFGAIAAECSEHRGLHLNPTDLILEHLPGDEEPAGYRVVITYLHNYAMPFVRYDTGDLAELDESPCPCGRSTGRLLRIVGRVSDMIRLPNGAYVHGEFFTHLLYDTTGVRNFQFVQEAPKSFVLRVVANPTIVEAYGETWRRRILQVAGGDADVRVERVNEIPTLASGKRRFTISLNNAR